MMDGVMHLLPTGVKHVHCRVAWSLKNRRVTRHYERSKSIKGQSALTFVIQAAFVEQRSRRPGHLMRPTCFMYVVRSQ